MLKNYKKFVKDCWRYEPKNSELHRQLGYTALAMVSEVGEAGDAVKKVLRGDEISTKIIIDECGDVLYYMTQLLSLLGDYDLEDAMGANIEKLNRRKIYGKEQAA